MRENDISGIIVDAAIEVHRILGGPGLLESVYHEALTVELKKRNLKVQTEKPVPVVYKGVTLRNPGRGAVLPPNDNLVGAGPVPVWSDQSPNRTRGRMGCQGSRVER